jgi:DNA replication and repair protein RecF
VPLLLHKLNLTHFRGYDALRLDFAGARIVVLTGPNGAGKTNILEAVSLLVPGKGLRGADLLDMKNRQASAEDLWAVAAEVETASGLPARLGTGLDREFKRRLIRINGRDAKSQNELAPLISAVWLTPQMDRLFLDGASGRRKFFDRLAFAFDTEHAARINRYDKHLRERLKVLQGDMGVDPVWLSGLESRIAADAVCIAATRRHLLEQMSRYVEKLYAGKALFPVPEITVSGWAEHETGARPAIEIEETLKARFRDSRRADMLAGKSHEGVHRSDFIVTHKDRGMPASQCSTGEQKGLLVSIVLAHALMMQGEQGFTPILLLDEVAAHLDDARRDELFRYLLTLNGQIFLTGTDADIFAALKPAALFCAVEPGRVSIMNKDSARQQAAP